MLLHNNQPGAWALFRRAGIFYLILQTVIRLVLLWQAKGELSVSVGELLKMLAIGPVYDFSAFLWLALPMVLLLFVVPRFICDLKIYQRLLKTVCFGYVFTQLLTAVAEYFFWDEFKSRFNFIAVDYLIYTQELFGNIAQSYNVPLLLGGVLLVAIGMYRALVRPFDWPLEPAEWTQRLKVLAVYGLLLAVTTLGMKAEYLEKISPNRFNQEIGANGVYQFGFAFFNNELDYERFYRHDDNAKILAGLRQRLAKDGNVLLDDGITRRMTPRFASSAAKQKPNVVVILVESLSAGFTGLVQGAGPDSWTPYLDDLTDEAYTFERVYATGTRTVRGIEAVSLSLPPTPGQSIVRRAGCAGLYDFGTPFRRQGYTTDFIYGGYGYFDNMNDFFAGNDFRVLDRTDIPSEKIHFDTVWGVADEILFDQTLELLDKQAAKQEPALQLLLTTSNHRPFTFPEGRIDEPQGQRESVVRYTDWAIHQFLEKAKTRPWFDNTVFIIIADHNASVAGKVGLPVSNYHIPCIVYAPRLIGKGENPRFMSQIDVIPTVMGMLGMNYEARHLGYDINKLAAGEERFFISTYQQLGYVYKDKLLILSPGNKAEAYHIDNYDLDEYTPIPVDEEMLRGAMEWYQGASYLFKNGMLKEK